MEIYTCQICIGDHADASYLLLGIGPTGNLDDHVEDGLLLVGEQRNVVEGRDWLAIFLEVDAVLEGVRGGDGAHSIRI